MKSATKPTMNVPIAKASARLLFVGVFFSRAATGADRAVAPASVALAVYAGGLAGGLAAGWLATAAGFFGGSV